MSSNTRKEYVIKMCKFACWAATTMCNFFFKFELREYSVHFGNLLNKGI